MDNIFKEKCDNVFNSLKNYRFHDNKNLNMHKLMISKDDEYYSYSFNDEHTLCDLRSISKLVVCLTIGIAIDNNISINGYPLNINTKIWPLIKDYVNLSNSKNIPFLDKITLGHLLNHTMGFDKGLLFSESIRDIKHEDLLDYLFNTNIVHNPGDFFAYSNAGCFTISVLIQELLGENLSSWVSNLLFKKLDITNFKWNNYGKHCAGATGLMLSIEDLHKIGILLANKGYYNEKRIVSVEWITFIMAKSIDTPQLFDATRTFPKEGYGYGLWISKQGNVVYCDGTDGQYVVTIPKEKIVISTLGNQNNMKPITKCMESLLSYIK